MFLQHENKTEGGIHIDVVRHEAGCAQVLASVDIYEETLEADTEGPTARVGQKRNRSGKLGEYEVVGETIAMRIANALRALNNSG